MRGVLGVALCALALVGCVLAPSAWSPATTQRWIEPYMEMELEELTAQAHSLESHVLDPEYFAHGRENIAYVFYALGLRLWSEAETAGERAEAFRNFIIATNVSMKRIERNIEFGPDGHAVPRVETVEMNGLPEAELMVWCLKWRFPEQFGPTFPSDLRWLARSGYRIAADVEDDPSHCNTVLS